MCRTGGTQQAASHSEPGTTSSCLPATQQLADGDIVDAAHFVANSQPVIPITQPSATHKAPGRVVRHEQQPQHPSVDRASPASNQPGQEHRRACDEEPHAKQRRLSLDTSENPVTATIGSQNQDGEGMGLHAEPIAPSATPLAVRSQRADVDMQEPHTHTGKPAAECHSAGFVQNGYRQSLHAAAGLVLAVSYLSTSIELPCF